MKKLGAKVTKIQCYTFFAQFRGQTVERRKREECGGRWKVVDLSERAGKSGYNGTRCALIRESRNGLRPHPGGDAEILRR